MENKIPTYMQRFIKGCNDKGYSFNEVSAMHYCGGSGRTNHKNYFKLQFPGREFLPLTNKCICNHDIEENCYVTNQDKSVILVMGNCCIQRYIKKCTRTCCKCGNPHRNRKDDICKSCRTK